MNLYYQKPRNQSQPTTLVLLICYPAKALMFQRREQMLEINYTIKKIHPVLCLHSSPPLPLPLHPGGSNFNYSMVGTMQWKGVMSWRGLLWETQELLIQCPAVNERACWKISLPESSSLNTARFIPWALEL